MVSLASRNRSDCFDVCNSLVCQFGTGRLLNGVGVVAVTFETASALLDQNINVDI